MGKSTTTYISKYQYSGFQLAALQYLLGICTTVLLHLVVLERETDHSNHLESPKCNSSHVVISPGPKSYVPGYTISWVNFWANLDPASLWD